jgi:hypothetical protein
MQVYGVHPLVANNKQSADHIILQLISLHK